MRRVCCVVLGLVGAVPMSAQADVLSVHASLQTGGAGGTGLGGAAKSEAFHSGAQGAAFGATLGMEVLFIDSWVEHLQYHTTDGLAGTWTQFMVGVDLSADLTGKTKGGTKDAKSGKIKGKRYAPLFVELGMAFGFGVGTGQQIDLPLDNAEVSDKGFLAQLSLGIGYRFHRLLSVGAKVPVQGAYMFKSGVANDLNNHYQSVQASILLNLRAEFIVK